MLEVSNVAKDYMTAAGPLSVLKRINLRVARGESVSIIGPSGSGKSTLLYILGALEPPSTGTVSLGERDPFTLSEQELAMFRNSQIGFVFQDHCLLPQCSVIENVLAPTFVGARDGGADARAKMLIDQVGLTPRLHHRPPELSGGEKQRVAIARALVRRPLLVLCDEPTGNLDRASAEIVGSLLLELHRKQNTILVVVTHSGDLAARCTTRLELVDGTLQPVTP